MKSVSTPLFAAALLCAALTSCNDNQAAPYAVAQQFKSDHLSAAPVLERAYAEGMECAANFDSVVYADGYSSTFLEGRGPMNSEYRLYDAKKRPIVTISRASECSPNAWVYIYDDDKLMKILTIPSIDYEVSKLYKSVNSVAQNSLPPYDARRVVDKLVNSAPADTNACSIDFVYNDRGQLAEVTDGCRSVRAPQGEWLTARPGKNGWFWSSDINGGFYVLFIYDKDGNEIDTFPRLDFEGLPQTEDIDESVEDYE